MITGVLPSFAERLLRQPRPPRGTLSGQVIALGAGSRPYLAVDSDGHLHLLLAPAAVDLSRLQQFRRSTFNVDNRPWSVSGAPIENYLDLSLIAPPSSALRRPFLSFCEDILTDIENGLTPETAVYRTCARWKRFWEEGETVELSPAWALGLMAELAVLELLIRDSGAAVVRFWTGPEGTDHDFQVGTQAALEVKASVRMPPIIECGLAQLDNGGSGDLVLVVFHATPREGATSIASLVEEIEARLSFDEEALDLFLRKLVQAGYRRHLVAEYGAFTYDLAQPIFHMVEGAFPRITHASFAAPLDARVRSVRYTLELSGLSPLSLGDPRLVAALGAFRQTG